MTDTNFPLSADSDLDDLPRTLRREHEARAREAREREEQRRRDAPPADAPRYLGGDDNYAAERIAAELPPGTVTRIEVPFFRLMAFFLKAVIAAIPALILLGVILWFGGQLLQTFYPELVKMRILISFPNG